MRPWHNDGPFEVYFNWYTADTVSDLSIRSLPALQPSDTAYSRFKTRPSPAAPASPLAEALKATIVFRQQSRLTATRLVNSYDISHHLLIFNRRKGISDIGSIISSKAR